MKTKKPSNEDGFPLHLKYRPTRLEQVIGQDAVAESLESMFRWGKCPHAFLFTGPSGVGKTTLARIIASHLKATVLEIDAATNTGIDAMRAVQDMARYKPLNNERRLIIVDECHALSKPTWQSLLKIVEEPPAHLYWIFCTTEPDKVPATIKTRCTQYQLGSVSWEEISEFLKHVSDEEGGILEPRLVDVVARKANGSVRAGLVYLQKCVGVNDASEVARLCEGGEAEGEAAITLIRAVCQAKGLKWPNLMKLIEGIDETPEGVRLALINYAAKMAREANQPQRYLAIIQAFSGHTYSPSEHWAPFMLDLGQLVFE